MKSGKESKFVIPQITDINNVNIDAVGIDLGTSRCFAAVNRRWSIETVVLGNTGERGLPSYVSFKEKEEKCGQIAIQQLHQNEKSIVFDSKRIIGRRINDVVKDSNWPFELININDKPILRIQITNGLIQKSPENVASILLKHIKQKLDEFQGKKLTEAVITVPATFTENQRKATHLAGIQAGWKKIHLLPEPIAASLAYFVGRPIPNNFKMLLFDFGGGTLDVCIMDIHDGNLHIISAGGDSNLGGRDFDNLLFDYFSEILKKNYQIDVSSKHKLKYNLLKNCMEIKHTLSNDKTATLDVSDFNTSIENTFLEISRQKFENLATILLNKIKNVIIETIGSTEYNVHDINKVLLAGGSSHMPMVKHLLLNIFKKAEHSCDKNPDEIVAIGAAYYSYSLRHKVLRTTLQRLVEKQLFDTSTLKQNINFISNDKFTMTGLIKDGMFSRVYKGKMGDQDVAMKVALKNGRKKIRKELQIYDKIKHPNILKAIGVHLVFDNILFMPLRSCNLKEYLSDFSDTLGVRELIVYCIQIADAMKYLHQMNILHCDLKIDNILIKDDEENVELSDFGCAIDLDNDQDVRYNGTITHMAYELIKTYLDSKYKGTASKASDVWAYAITVWQIFSKTEKIPHDFSTAKEIADNYEKGKKLPMPKFMPQKLWRYVLLACFDLEPECRPTMAELYEVLPRML